MNTILKNVSFVGILWRGVCSQRLKIGIEVAIRCSIARSFLRRKPEYHPQLSFFSAKVFAAQEARRRTGDSSLCGKKARVSRREFSIKSRGKTWEIHWKPEILIPLGNFVASAELSNLWVGVESALEYLTRPHRDSCTLIFNIERE